ncbi:MAG: hypothetical protein ACPG4K_13590, partial [Haloferula sp.]
RTRDRADAPISQAVFHSGRPLFLGKRLVDEQPLAECQHERRMIDSAEKGKFPAFLVAEAPSEA